MDSIEAEGDSIDAAISAALAKLGVPRERVAIEILNDASRGFLGLGGKKAKIRATLRQEVDVDSPVAVSSDAAGVVAEIDATLDQPADAVDEPAVAREAALAEASHDEGPDEDAGTDETPYDAAPATAVLVNDKVETAEETSPITRDESAEPQAVDARSDDRQDSRPPRRPPRPIEPRIVERSEEVLREIVRHIGVDATVAGRIEGDHIALDIHGDASGILIGRKGQMLDALEYIVARVLAKDEERTIHVTVDSEGYRERRRQSLEEMAQRMANDAKRKGRAVKLNAMSPRDRRIVHMVLQRDKDLSTRSSGKGHFRKLVIIPNGVRVPPDED